MSIDRTTVLYIAMSLDGYIADEFGEVNWLQDVEGKGDNGYSVFYETIDTIIMGRTTYDQILTFKCAWPYSGKKCYVFTKRNSNPDHNVEFVNDGIVDLMKSLKAQKGRKIWLAGGAGIIDSFIKQGLIDEFIIAVIPIILGNGIRLFKGNNPKTRLLLKEIKQSKEIALLYYKVKPVS
jgi:dihydrofolate reductase